jgi:predicted nucleic acid-binding protein
MPTHLLDTSVYSQPLKPKPLRAVESRWRELGDEALCISVICEAEVLYGLELKQSSNLRQKYDVLLKDRLPVLAIDSMVAQTFAQMKATGKRAGRPASDFDFLIAATAKAHALVLATVNVRHFVGIQGLAVEDWSKGQ